MWTQRGNTCCVCGPPPRTGDNVVVYLSGPITGIKDRNVKTFQKTQKEIRALVKAECCANVKIINPVRLDLKLDKTFAAFGKTPDWKDYMRVCVRELCAATYVFSLRNWPQSERASFERYAAKKLGIPCAETYTELVQIIKGGDDANWTAIYK
jgi:hypothetical protein